MYYDAQGVQDHTCNCVYLPYGDGASFSGFREEVRAVAPPAVCGCHGFEA
jgi:hypothetical protein